MAGLGKCCSTYVTQVTQILGCNQDEIQVTPGLPSSFKDHYLFLLSSNILLDPAFMGDTFLENAANVESMNVEALFQWKKGGKIPSGS